MNALMHKEDVHLDVNVIIVEINIQQVIFKLQVEKEVQKIHLLNVVLEHNLNKRLIVLNYLNVK